MAEITGRARCLNVAQPRPYNPGSLVSTLTTINSIPLGQVAIAFTLVIFNGGNPRVAAEKTLAMASLVPEKAPIVVAAVPRPRPFNTSRLLMSVLSFLVSIFSCSSCALWKRNLTTSVLTTVPFKSIFHRQRNWSIAPSLQPF